MGYLFILAAVVVLVILALRYYPPLGARAKGDARSAIDGSDNYVGGKFIYPLPTPMEMSFKEMSKIMTEMIKGGSNRKPSNGIPIDRWEPQQLLEVNSEARLVWFGHSAFFLQVNGLNLLLDPMLGPSPSPVPMIGGKRYGGELPLSIDDLPPIDAVILSHDHYDHLDYGTIKKLKNKVRRFFVPLGVGAHLERWGVARERITSADWWDEMDFEGLKLACTPARHFSGRSMNDRYQTLWCSWVIDSGETKLYFSGDSGYGGHFKQIGDKYGPFDVTLMECGQYDMRWPLIHMMPEETVQAHRDVGGKVMIPIHWGAFTLALHDWTDPVERVLRAAEQHSVVVATPRIGQVVPLSASEYPAAAWWRTKE